MKTIKALIALLLLAAIAGCGQFYPVPLDQNALVGVENVALTGPTEPPRYELIDNGLFVGGILATSQTIPALQKNGADFKAEMEQMGFFPGKEAQQAITSALQNKQFRVSYFDAPRGGLMPYSFASNYNSAPATAQLILDVSVQLAYTNTSTDDFIPGVALLTRLTEKKTGKIVMVGRVDYRGAYKGGPVGDLIADANCNYASIQELRNSPGRAIACFREGIKQTSVKLAAMLRQ